MSVILHETPDGPKVLRLGETFEDATQVNRGKEPQIAPSITDMLAMARQYNQSLRQKYQSLVRETDRGKTRCMYCIGEDKRREQLSNQAGPSNTSSRQENPLNTYVYTPLSRDAIRVLELEPAEDYDAPLRATMATQETREAKSYAALSYTWSGVANTGILDLGSGSLEITGNLDLALRALRPKDAVLRIWVDAVNINQTDLNEKSIQVARMDDTYKAAASVMAWLGAAGDVSSEALEYMKEISELSKTSPYDKHIRPRSVDSDSMASPIDMDTAAELQEMRKALCVDDVLGRLWFTRLWVVQEVLLAKQLTLYLGKDSIMWEDLRRAVKMLWSAECQYTVPVGPEPNQTGPIFHSLILIAARDQLQSLNMGTDLYRDYTTQIYGKCREMRKWGCQDERDRVYGIIGFIPSDSNMKIEPDYTADISEVYTQFARKHITHEGLAILLYSGIEQRHNPRISELFKQFLELELDDFYDSPDLLNKLDLPSWVPELRENRQRVPRRYWAPLIFNTAMNFEPGVVLHKECPHILAVKGCVFDKITQPLPVEISRPGGTGLMSYVETCKYLTFIWMFMNNHYAERGGYPTGEPLESVLTNVITVEKTCTKLKGVAEDRGPGWIDRMVGLLRSGCMGDYASLSGKNYEDFAKFCSCLSFLLLHDHFMISEEGYMGLVPDCSKAGDVIAWINEVQTPVVLRPLIEGQYQLVGPCFLYGFMHGELESLGFSEEMCTFIELV